MVNFNEKNEIIILVHGFFRGKPDMFPLKELLHKFDYEIFMANLPTTFTSFNGCCSSFELQFNDDSLKLSRYKKIHFVGHSMGGLIVRNFLSRNKLSNIGRCVLIATPNSGSVLAEILSKLIFPPKIFKPLKYLRPSAPEIAKPLNSDPIDFGVIAGNNNKLLAGKLFMFKKGGDGRVETDSTKFDLMTDFVELPYDHHTIHHQKETALLICNFLKTGKFLVSPAQVVMNEVQCLDIRGTERDS